MADTGYPRSPKLEKGALVQLVPGLVGVVPTIVAFQYNPTKLSREVEPWVPGDVGGDEHDSTAEDVQPVAPQERFTLTLELDATDDLEDGSAIAERVGVADRIAALRKLVEPSEGVLGDLLVSARALAKGAGRQMRRPTVATTLFVWGPGRILPVRITSFKVEETLHTPALYPLQAEVTLMLEVLTPDRFRDRSGAGKHIAIAAYNATRAQEEALAAVRVATDITEIRALLPF